MKNADANAKLMKNARLQLVLDVVYGQKASEALQERSQGRKALKSKVEVTLGSKHWPTASTKAHLL